ncbi:MAG: transcriptional antiterminator [Candidatus Frackibacter sp. T328-2]|nr:MAG: transcriptional antiterminator [Candidatus Frackibacter sp. T328-2]
MRRKEKVYHKLKEICYDRLSLDELRNRLKIGFSAGDIADELGIARSNASRDLNSLHKEGEVIKITGKPVYFLDREFVEEVSGVMLEGEYLKFSSSKELFRNNIRHKGISNSKVRSEATKPSINPEVKSKVVSKDRLQPKFKVDLKNKPASEQGDYILANLIGNEGSLKTQVQQAQAAIIYPPNGLHTLILGPTGVGKTMFAELMHRFAIETERLTNDAPFVSFNCADYANNPQLLLSQLFGYAKGAFTGAKREKDGLIEKAEDGILFLDEIHRLPPEGQEMLFYLIDKGLYRKLGETEADRKINLLIIAATTESPESSLLRTFTRRIPMVIELPPLSERPLKERLRLIKIFFQEEAARMNATVKVTREVLRALLLYNCPGNIGQLKSDIQLCCARAFLDHLSGNEPVIKIGLDRLSSHVKEGILKIEDNRVEVRKVLKHIGDKFIVNANSDLGEGKEHVSLVEGFDNIYETLERQMVELETKGIQQQEINRLLSADIDIFFKRFLNKFKDKETAKEEELEKIVDKEIIEVAKEMLVLAEEELDRELESRILFGLAMHLSATLERIEVGKEINNPHLDEIKANHKKEFIVANKMVNLLETKVGINVPRDEVGFIAMFLYSGLEEGEEQGKVGIVVITHGSAAATSMADVANTLLNVDHAVGVDMPLERSPEEILEIVKGVVNDVEQGKGILLLVDMGSLITFGEILSKELKIPIRTVDLVSTPMVLEATRKAVFTEVTLDELAETVEDMSSFSGRLGVNKLGESETGQEEKVILAVCMTGQGSAIKLKKLITESIPLIKEKKIKVLTISINRLEKDKDYINQIMEEKDVLAIVGTFDPQVKEVPFISLQSLLARQGIKELQNLIKAKITVVNQENKEANEIYDRIEDTFNHYLKFVNPRLVLTVIKDLISKLEVSLNIRLDKEVKVGLIMHLGCTIERLIKGEEIEISEEELIEIDRIKEENKEEIKIIANKIGNIEDEFNIKFPLSELAYVMKIIKYN